MKKKILLGVALLLMVTLTACATTETPEQAVNNALKGFKEADSEKIEEYFGELNGFVDPATGETDEATRLILEHLEYETLSSEENGKEAVVETEIKNVDMLPIMEEYFEQVVELEFDEDATEEEMGDKFQALVIELLNEDDLETFTTKVDVRLEEVENEWKIHLDEGLMNALLGRFELGE